jgi:predicted XRE-type DNA-binding protein
VVAGEAYQAIALDFGVSRRTIGKVARGELHGSEDVLRRRAPVRRLTLGEARHAVELARKGLSQRAIALELGTNQPRISRLLRGVCIAL